MRLSTLARKTEEGPCVDTPGWQDYYSYGCDWYEEYYGCEEYAHYGADIHCCICQGFDVSSSPSVSYKPSSAPSVSSAPSISSAPSSLCVDTPGWVDRGGDGCDWYLENEWGCESYYDLGADIHCCVCQGFDVSSSPSVSYKPSSAPSVSSAPSISYKPSSAGNVSLLATCLDTPGAWVDYDDGCEYYGCEELYAHYGADIHCCNCQGSSSPSVSYKPSSAPSASSAPSISYKPSSAGNVPLLATCLDTAGAWVDYDGNGCQIPNYDLACEELYAHYGADIHCCVCEKFGISDPWEEPEYTTSSVSPASSPRNPEVKINFPPKQSIMIWAILQTISSCLSLIATITIIVMIARSYAKLSSTFHRLLLGLCIADILSSIGYMLSTTPVPSNYSEDIWNASGNTATCTAQGFILFLGLMASQLYNCSLCMYYLIIIKYNKKDDYIRKFVEPWLHAVPILISLIGGITIAAKKAFNAGYTNCSIRADPPGCISNDALECTRGGDAKTLFLVFATIPYITVPCVIASTMGIMYYTARQNEKRMKGYGIHTLRLNTATTTVSSNMNDETESSNENISSFQKLRMFFRLSSSASSTSSQSSRSRKLNKQSKAVLQKALAYSLAYLATFICPFIISIINLAGGEASFGLSLMSRILFPLQGLFNFFVFIFPRIQSAKRGNANLSWSRAFIYALKSRGSRPKGVARRKN